MSSPVAEVSTDQLSYTVPEDVGQLEVWINITNGQKAPGQECRIAISTIDGTATGELKCIFACISGTWNTADIWNTLDNGSSRTL